MSANKTVLIISPNPLFTEVLAALLSGGTELDLVSAPPDAAAAEIQTRHPQVIVIDEAVETSLRGQLLLAAHGLPCTQILLMNLRGNDFVVLDSRRAVIRRTSDLIQAISKAKSMDINVQEVPPLAPSAAAQTRAGLFAFLATLLNQAPDVDLVRRLRTVGAETFVLGPADGEVNAVVGQGLREIAQFVETTRDQPAEAVQQALAVDWTRLFRGVSPRYGPPPPYEGLYTHAGSDQPEVMQGINQIYAQNSAALTDEAHNRPDYLGLELAFLGFLAEREAAHWEQGKADQALDCAMRARAFLVEHPGRWAGEFVSAALPKAQTDFYRGYLRLTQAVLAEAVTEVMA
jgi:TorA maturation chaperone TorD